jgi:hypothetical protein
MSSEQRGQGGTAMATYWWVRSAVYAGLIVAAVAALTLLATRPGRTASTAAASWEARIEAVEHSAARGDLSRAVYAWGDAYGEAWRSRRWEALLAVGDAAVHIDRESPGPNAFRSEARRAYLAALLRARAVGSREGIRRAAAAFARLGDVEMAERALAMASGPGVERAGR